MVMGVVGVVVVGGQVCLDLERRVAKVPTSLQVVRKKEIFDLENVRNRWWPRIVYQLRELTY